MNNLPCFHYCLCLGAVGAIGSLRIRNKTRSSSCLYYASISLALAMLASLNEIEVLLVILAVLKETSHRYQIRMGCTNSVFERDRYAVADFSIPAKCLK